MTGNVAFSQTYRRFFRRNPAGIDIDIAENMYSPPPSHPVYYVNTHYYDGPTHTSYLRPSRTWERWYCSKLPWKENGACTEFIKKCFDTNYHASNNTEVRVDPVKGRTIYASKRIPKGHFIYPRDAASAISFDEDHYNNFKQFIDDVPSASLYRTMYNTIDGYGFQSSGHGFGGYVVTTTSSSFMNHGCNERELNANPLMSLTVDEDYEESNSYFAPILTRRNELFSISVFASRDIDVGEEILFDYALTDDEGVLDETEAKMCAGGSGYFTVQNNLISDEDN